MKYILLIYGDEKRWAEMGKGQMTDDARRAARLSADGDLVPLDEQNRSLWDRAQIDEGVALLDDALTRRTPGPYQTQAAIAALHATAATAADTDWLQIAALYRALFAFTPTPIVELNAIVALATDLEHALTGIPRLESDPALAQYHLLPASKADILRVSAAPPQRPPRTATRSRSSRTPPSAATLNSALPRASVPRLNRPTKELFAVVGMKDIRSAFFANAEDRRSLPLHEIIE